MKIDLTTAKEVCLRYSGGVDGRHQAPRPGRFGSFCLCLCQCHLSSMKLATVAMRCWIVRVTMNDWTRRAPTVKYLGYPWHSPSLTTNRANKSATTGPATWIFAPHGYAYAKPLGGRSPIIATVLSNYTIHNSLCTQCGGKTD